MPENSKTTEASPSAPDHPSPEAPRFVERMKAIFEFSKTRSDDLNDLYNNDLNRFTEALDDAVEEIAQSDQEFIKAFRQLKEARSTKRDEKQIVDDLNAIRSKIKQIIVSEAGLPNETQFTQIEQARNNVTSLLAESSVDGAVAKPDDILRILGIHKVDDDKDVYAFPYDLMPDSVVEKWQTYLAFVCSHVALANKSSEAFNQKAVMEADRARKYAHDSVNNDVNAILGLEGIDGWKKMDTRELLEKIRDCELSGIITGPNGEDIELINSHERQMHAVTSLCYNATSKCY